MEPESAGSRAAKHLVDLEHPENQDNWALVQAWEVKHHSKVNPKVIQTAQITVNVIYRFEKGTSGPTHKKGLGSTWYLLVKEGQNQDLQRQHQSCKNKQMKQLNKTARR